MAFGAVGLELEQFFLAILLDLMEVVATEEKSRYKLVVAAGLCL